MAALDEASRGHEEYRLRLAAEKDIRLAGLDAQRQIAEAQATVLAAGLEKADISIVGGEDVFFDRLLSAVSAARSVDTFVDTSTTAQALGAAWLDGSGRFTDDATRVLTALGANNGAAGLTALLGRLASGQGAGPDIGAAAGGVPTRGRPPYSRSCSPPPAGRGERTREEVTAAPATRDPAPGDPAGDGSAPGDPAGQAGEQVPDAYAVLRTRLAASAAELGRRAQALDAARTAVFGAGEMLLTGVLRPRTERPATPADIAAVGPYLLFAANPADPAAVEDVGDVFQVLRPAGSDPESSAGDAAATPVAAPPGLLDDPVFLRDFRELYRYYRQTRLLRLRAQEGRLLAVFRTGAEPGDVRVLSWRVGPDGACRYQGAARESPARPAGAPALNWMPLGREHQVPGRRPHLAVPAADGGVLTLDTTGGLLRIRTGDTVHEEPVDDALQSLADADAAFAAVGPLVLLRVRPYREDADRYFTVNTRTARIERTDVPAHAYLPLPEGQGVVFPGGVALAAGGTRTFDLGPQADPGRLEFERLVRAPGGAEVLYVFHAADDGRRLLLPYDLVRQEAAAPLHVQGCALYEDGTLLTLRPADGGEAGRVHTLQVRRTPFAADTWAPPAGDGPLQRIGNPDLVRAVSDTLALVRAAQEPAPTTAQYEALAAAADRVLDRHPWLAATESGGDPAAAGLAGPVAAIRDTARQALVERARVRDLIGQADRAAGQAEERIAALRPADPRRIGRGRRRVGPQAHRTRHRAGTVGDPAGDAVRRPGPAGRRGRRPRAGVRAGRGPRRRVLRRPARLRRAPRPRRRTRGLRCGDRDGGGGGAAGRGARRAGRRAGHRHRHGDRPGRRRRGAAHPRPGVGSSGARRGQPGAGAARGAPHRAGRGRVRGRVRRGGRPAGAGDRRGAAPPRTPRSVATSNSAACSPGWSTWPRGSPPSRSGRRRWRSAGPASSRPSPAAASRLADERAARVRALASSADRVLDAVRRRAGGPGVRRRGPRVLRRRPDGARRYAPDRGAAARARRRRAGPRSWTRRSPPPARTPPGPCATGSTCTRTAAPRIRLGRHRFAGQPPSPSTSRWCRTTAAWPSPSPAPTTGARCATPHFAATRRSATARCRRSRPELYRAEYLAATLFRASRAPPARPGPGTAAEAAAAAAARAGRGVRARRPRPRRGADPRRAAAGCAAGAGLLRHPAAVRTAAQLFWAHGADAPVRTAWTTRARSLTRAGTAFAGRPAAQAAALADLAAELGAAAADFGRRQGTGVGPADLDATGTALLGEYLFEELADEQAGFADERRGAGRCWTGSSPRSAAQTARPTRSSPPTWRPWRTRRRPGASWPWRGSARSPPPKGTAGTHLLEAAVGIAVGGRLPRTTRRTRPSPSASTGCSARIRGSTGRRADRTARRTPRPRTAVPHRARCPRTAPTSAAAPNCWAPSGTGCAWTTTGRAR